MRDKDFRKKTKRKRFVHKENPWAEVTWDDVKEQSSRRDRKCA